jgi:hypothetical protein
MATVRKSSGKFGTQWPFYSLYSQFFEVLASFGMDDPPSVCTTVCWTTPGNKAFGTPKIQMSCKALAPAGAKALAH